MTVKLVLLKSGENLICDIKQGFFEEKLVCYFLEKPCIVQGKNTKITSLESWPLFSKQNTIEIFPEWIVTMVDPNDELQKMYRDQVLTIKQNETYEDNSINEQSHSDQSD